jgi:hypothetical protein
MRMQADFRMVRRNMHFDVPRRLAFAKNRMNSIGFF